MLNKTLLTSVLLCFLFCVTGSASPIKKKQHANELKEILKKEKKAFHSRERKRRLTLGQLDSLNFRQNEIRTRLHDLEADKAELEMSLQNMEVQLERKRQRLRLELQRTKLLIRVLYKTKRDGWLGFVLGGEKLSSVIRQFRTLQQAVRSHTIVTRKLKQRFEHLQLAEKELASAKEEANLLYKQLRREQRTLRVVLSKKRTILSVIHQKQVHYRRLLREYRRVSKQVALLVRRIEKKRPKLVSPKRQAKALKNKKRLGVFPLLSGKMKRTFGRSVHKEFGTRTFHKGIEVEAPHNAPVRAILDGSVEFVGWVKGRGNVVVLHHGEGLYSLSGHLFRTEVQRGDTVAQASTVGYVGDTGNNSTPSLYFEVREKTKGVNPIRYFPKDVVKEFWSARPLS